MGIFFYGCITLDGYLADKNHGLDWLHQCGAIEETSFDEFYRHMDFTVMGRRTFREIAGMEHPEEVYPTTQNYVFTHEEQASREGFRFVSGSVPEFVRGIGPGKNVWIIGGNTILSPLLEADMVDHLIVQVAPVLLGGGIPLFAQKEGLKRFHLNGVRQYGAFAELFYSRK